MVWEKKPWICAPHKVLRALHTTKPVQRRFGIRAVNHHCQGLKRSSNLKEDQRRAAKARCAGSQQVDCVGGADLWGPKLRFNCLRLVRGKREPIGPLP
jgi:hypothetical protein